MAGLDDLIATFMGQTNSALESPAAPWQQELLESVNPEKVKRQNIARALAKASQTLATTPGNFLQGVSAAASTGADAYLTGRDQAEQERLKVQQLLQLQQQKDQDRRLQLLMDAVGVQRNSIQDQRQAEQDAYGRTKDEREWGIRQKESEARQEYYKRRGRGAGANGELTQSQILTTKRAIRGELKTLENQLNETAKLNESITPEAIQQQLDERRMELEDYYGITLDSPDAPQQTVMPGKADQVVTKNTPKVPDPATNEGILAAPQGAVDFLKKNPQYRDQFDQKYGPGAAARILGQ